MNSPSAAQSTLSTTFCHRIIYSKASEDIVAGKKKEWRGIGQSQEKEKEPVGMNNK